MLMTIVIALLYLKEVKVPAIIEPIHRHLITSRALVEGPSLWAYLSLSTLNYRHQLTALCKCQLQLPELHSAKCQLPLVAIAIEMSYVLFCDNVGGRQLTAPTPCAASIIGAYVVQ